MEGDYPDHVQNLQFLNSILTLKIISDIFIYAGRLKIIISSL